MMSFKNSKTFKYLLSITSIKDCDKMNNIARAGKKFRLQSAMEYLMTYGWAILIIAVVLGVLYSLGIFNGNTALGTSCISIPGYLCQNPSMTSAGLLSFTFGQNTNTNAYNVGFACAAVASSTGMPNTGATNPWMFPSSTSGAVSGTIPANTYTALPGGQLTITGLQCYGSTGSAFNPGAIGATYTGKIWLNYTSTSGTPSSNWLTNPIATLTVRTT
jgi:hypothetical protein